MEADAKADIIADESAYLMEPMLLGAGFRNRGAITDLALELARRSEGFKRSLPPHIVSSLADLVRSMNCYYSNLIEGHNTHPIDIERALRNDYSKDARKRDLQREAQAHIEVQKWIDEGGLTAERATTEEGICEVHRRFCKHLPEDMLWVEDPDPKERIRVIPGEIRTRHVKVGDHIAISPGVLPRFMERFALVYGREGRTETIIATAAAHHRLLWMHPFLDGNGRVARLMSHAQLLGLLNTGGIWSIARGLGRSVDEYKQRLANCDLPRRNELDGRGSLSEEALGEFTVFFLQVCLDQVAFMESLMQPDLLRTRIHLWVEEKIQLGELPAKSGLILEAILYRGELPRGDADVVLGAGERQARRIVSALIEKGVVVSESTRSPLRLAFPATLASRWMPGLFPDHPTN